MNKHKGQVSLEYLIMTSFLLAVTVIFFGFAIFLFNENAAIAEAESAVLTIENNANFVASLGDESKVYFEVNVPENTTSFNVTGKSITMIVGANNIFTYSKVNLTPQSFSTHGGRKIMSASFEDGNVVVREGA